MREKYNLKSFYGTRIIVILNRCLCQCFLFIFFLGLPIATKNLPLISAFTVRLKTRRFIWEYSNIGKKILNIVLLVKEACLKYVLHILLFRRQL